MIRLERAQFRRVGEDAVKYPVMILAVLAVYGCSDDRVEHVTTAPSLSGSTALVSLWGMVIDFSGGCIEGGTVRVVAGQSVGEVITQDANCDAWAYGGGFVFKNLSPGAAMTIRASAPGYRDVEQTLDPGFKQSTAVLFVLFPTEVFRRPPRIQP